MHRPNEAVELWCPMVRIARSESVSHGEFEHETAIIVGGCNSDALGAASRSHGRRMDPDHKPLASCRCIADKCAMWRWGEWIPLDDGKIPFKGYCGIAGRPEVAS